MKDRKISSKQLETLVLALEKHVPEVHKHIDDHKWFMGNGLGYDVGDQVATLDYFLHHLRPFEEGYAMCFLDHIVDGQDRAPTIDGDPCEGGCPKVFELIKIQRPRFLEQISQHQWYKGEELHRPVGEEEAKDDFLGTKYFTEWGSGYRTCYEERVCPLRANCKSSNIKIEKII